MAKKIPWEDVVMHRRQWAHSVGLAPSTYAAQHGYNHKVMVPMLMGHSYSDVPIHKRLWDKRVLKSYLAWVDSQGGTVVMYEDVVKKARWAMVKARMAQDEEGGTDE